MCVARSLRMRVLDAGALAPGEGHVLDGERTAYDAGTRT